MPERMSLEDRFWSRVDKKGPDDCWEWTGYIGDWGYGTMQYGYNSSAHRISYEIAYGPIPKGKKCLHKCDNRKCVNPNHLYLGTQSDNMYDRAKRNPNNQGGREKGSKFYEGEAWLMKKLWKSGKFTQGQIAKMFKCSRNTIGHIVNGRTTNFKIAPFNN